jgi:DNA-binding response OmpR family regulator
MMGGSDSADFVASLRMQYPALKIIILSAIDSSLEKAKLIDSGADDYLAKPFETTEFQARLKSLVRRSETVSTNLNYEVSNISLDLIHRSVSVAGNVLNLTSKEFLVLHALCSSVGKIYSKNQLIETIWGFSLENETNVVESTVNSLRRNLNRQESELRLKIPVT